MPVPGRWRQLRRLGVGYQRVAGKEVDVAEAVDTIADRTILSRVVSDRMRRRADMSALSGGLNCENDGSEAARKRGHVRSAAALNPLFSSANPELIYVPRGTCPPVLSRVRTPITGGNT